MLAKPKLSLDFVITFFSFKDQSGKAIYFLSVLKVKLTRHRIKCHTAFQRHITYLSSAMDGCCG